jgi:hypothetical protein
MSTKQRTMAALGAPVVVPPGAPPPHLGVTQLPYAADPGSLTGWLLDSTTTETSNSISGGLERGFTRLVHNVLNHGDAGHEEAMQSMVDEIVNSDMFTPYLKATNFGTGEVRIRIIHSIARYSAGFGGSNALHGKTLGLLGEMREDGNGNSLNATLYDCPRRSGNERFYFLPLTSSVGPLLYGFQITSRGPPDGTNTSGLTR